MNEARLFELELKKHVCMNAARVKFLAGFIIALLKVCTVNLNKLAVAFPGTAQKDSKYKRLQRFFKGFRLDLEFMAKLFADLMLSGLKSWVLTIDRTNWKFGKNNINILTLGVAYKGIAVPLVWIPLTKRGNSNTSERIELIELFIKLFGADKIRCLTADREFIGTDWFSFLIEKGIPFSIRIRDNIQITNSRGKFVDAKNLFRMLKPGEHYALKNRRSLLGLELFVIGMRLKNGGYLILVTDSEPEAALEYYKQRWEIETLFGCLKKRGFDFESTHMTAPERIEKLVALLGLAFCWCHKTGEWISLQKEIKTKKHGRKAISIFRLGLDELREIVLNISCRVGDFIKYLNLLFSRANSKNPMSTSNSYYEDYFLSCT